MCGSCAADVRTLLVPRWTMLRGGSFPAVVWIRGRHRLPPRTAIPTTRVWRTFYYPTQRHTLYSHDHYLWDVGRNRTFAHHLPYMTQLR